MGWLFSSSRRNADVPAAPPAVPMQSTDPGAPSRRPVIIRIGTSLVIVAVLAVFLAAVATNHLPWNTTEAPVRGGSIVLGGGDVDSLLPYRTSHSGVAADQAIWAPLWYGDPQGIFRAGIAREVPSSTNGDISRDLTTWTIHLRTGLKWSDGLPLTAEDCAFSFNLYADPAYNAGQTFPTTDPNDPIGFAGASVSDSTTVILHLKHPYVGMLAVLADGVGTCLPKHVFSGMTAADAAKSPENVQPSVVSGPFMVKERVAGDHMIMARNPHYYQGPEKPYLDQITFKVGSSLANGSDPVLAALQSHAVDSLSGLEYTKLDSYRAIAAIAGYKTYLDRNPANFEALGFNMSDPLTSDLVVRQAFTMGFDDGDVLKLLNGVAQKTCDDSIGTFAHDPALRCYQYNPTAAGQALDADGWVMGADGYRHKNGQTLELVYATTDKTNRKQTAALIQRELKSIGMKIDVKIYTARDYFEGGSGNVLNGGHFQVAVWANGVGYDPDDHSMFASDQTPGDGNVMRYANSEVDAQELIQQSTADPAKRLEAFRIIHKDILHDLPVMYLYSAHNIAFARSDLRNYNPSAFGPAEMWNIWDWWLAPKGS